MAYPTVGNVKETTDRFVYFNLTPFSANGTTSPYTYEGAGGDNNVFEIYNATTQASLTGSGVRLGQFQFTQSDGHPSPDSNDINFYPRVLAGDVNGLTTGSVWLPIFSGSGEGFSLESGDWLVITTGSGTSMTNVKEIKFYWTGSSEGFSGTGIAGIADLKVLMSQVTNIPVNAGCWSYGNSSQAIRDAVTGSGAFILRFAGNGDMYDINPAQWYFPPGNQPGDTGFGTGSFNIPGGRVTQGSGPFVCYRARVYPAAFA
jgi:hypothetical protein